MWSWREKIAENSLRLDMIEKDSVFSDLLSLDKRGSCNSEADFICSAQREEKTSLLAV